MELTDIAPLEEWEKIEEQAFEKFGIQSSVFNPEGIRITSTKNFANRICPEIKSTDKGQTFICATAHMNMAGQAEKTRAPVVEECDAGLVKIVVPIFLDGRFVGSAGGCGALMPEGELDVFAVNKLSGIDETQIESLSDNIPVISKKTIDEACSFFTRETEALVARYRDKTKKAGQA